MKKILIVLFGLAVLAFVLWMVIPLFTNTIVDEKLPFAVDTPLVEVNHTPEVFMEDEPFEVIVDEDPITPTALKSGEFVGADNFHQASGTATIYKNGEELFLELKDFEVTNGPDLYVNLSVHPSPKNKTELGVEAIELEKLKGNKGNQIYRVSSDIDISEYQSAVIYCKAFRVIFGSAELR